MHWHRLLQSPIQSCRSLQALQDRQFCMGDCGCCCYWIDFIKIHWDNFSCYQNELPFLQSTYFLDALPIEAELHKRQLSFLYMLLSAENVKFKRIIERQLGVNFDNKDSFFYRIVEVLSMYNLPAIFNQTTLIRTNCWNELIWVTGHCNRAAVSRNRYGVEKNCWYS